MKNLKKQGWTVLATATGINFLAGLLYIWSVIKQGLKDDLGWTDTQATLPYTISLIAFVLTMVAIGPLQDRKGPRLTATIAGLLMGVGLILSSLHTDPTLMIITFGIITGAGVGISNVSTVPPAVKWFHPSRKGMITGITVAGVALASVFYSPFTHALIDSNGISTTFLIMGLGIMVLTVALARLLVNPPADFKPEPAKSKKNTKQGDASSHEFAESLNWRSLLKRLDFYMLWIMFAFSASAGLMIIGNVTIITSEQANWGGGFILVILLAVFNAIGRLLGGVIADKLHHYTLLAGIFVIAGLNMLLFPYYNSTVLVSIGFAVAGLCYGGGFAAFPTILVSKYGVKFYGSNYGLLMTAWGVGGIIGPMAAARVRDLVGNFGYAYYICFGLLMVALVIAIVTRVAAKKPEPEVEPVVAVTDGSEEINSI